MQVRAKAPHIELTVTGDEIPAALMEAIHNVFEERQIETRNGDDELVDPFASSWFVEILRDTTPGDVVRIYRENLGWSQERLSREIGSGWHKQRVSDIERGRRRISAEVALKLGKLFGIRVERILDPGGDRH